MTGRADTLPRGQAVARLAQWVAGRRLGHPTRVAVDGVTASGKSTLARELASAVSELGRPVIQVSMDGFHHPRARRHRQGRESAIGYYEDAYDFVALARGVARAARSRRQPALPHERYRPRNRYRDRGAGGWCARVAVFVVDGTFLQRPDIRDLWDERVWVDTPLKVARRRGVERDGDALGGPEAAERLFAKRYHAAAQIYIDAVAPAERATVVFGNEHPEHARLQFMAADP